MEGHSEEVVDQGVLSQGHIAYLNSALTGCAFCMNTWGDHQLAECPLMRARRAGVCVDCSATLDSCQCPRFALILAASLRLMVSGLRGPTITKYGLSPGFRGKEPITFSIKGASGLMWPDWGENEKLDLMIAFNGEGKIRIFDEEGKAMTWTGPSNVDNVLLRSSWQATVELVKAWLDRPSSKPPHQEITSSVLVRDSGMIAGSTTSPHLPSFLLPPNPPQPSLEGRATTQPSPSWEGNPRPALQELAAALKVISGKQNPLDRKHSKELWWKELKALSEGEWLQQELPLKKFLWEGEGRTVKKAKVVRGGNLEVKEVKKKQVEDWADWTMANLRVLQTCPNDRMGNEYLEYMTSRIRLQQEGLEWHRFKKYDEEFRRRRLIDEERWNHFYGDLWCLVSIPPLPTQPLSTNIMLNGSSKGGWVTKQAGKPQEPRGCRFFNNRGGCREKENCPLSHRCSICKSPSHNRFTCSQSGQVRD